MVESNPYSWLIYCNKFQCFPANCFSSNSPPLESPEKGCAGAETADKKAGGWKAVPFILGNEALERLGTIGLTANFMVFLLKVFNMDQVMASNVLNIWSGFSNFSPLIGAFISDAYLGRFKTIARAAFIIFTGMLTMTFIAWLPQLHPPPCKDQCVGPNATQFGVLVAALALFSIGSGGIRPCSLPFGVDQFDSSTKEGRLGITSFINWYYTCFTIVMAIALTLIVYIQSISWAIGFAIPTVLMLFAIVMFFVGTRVYVYVKPEGSCFTSVAQVIVAAYKKRKASFPVDDDEHVYYDPPLKEGTIVKKLPLTNQHRYLNKAALIIDGENLSDPWRLCKVQQVEEAKCIFKVIPVWASGIICFTAYTQQATFTITQALKMDRHLGPNFQVPEGSLGAISLITVSAWLPFYDRVLVPYIRKKTKIEGGITLFQRMGIGLVFSIVSMIASGFVERMRRSSALLHGGEDGVAPMTVFWLAPALVLMGFAEAFNFIGQLEFYSKEFPENMSSLANSMFSCVIGLSSCVNVVMVNVVHTTTGGDGRPDWLTNDINQGRVENFYFLVAGLGAINFGYFLWVASRYKGKYRTDDGDFVDDDVGLSAVNK